MNHQDYDTSGVSARVVEQLEQSLIGYDAACASKLNRARQAALSQVGMSQRLAWRWALGTCAAAALAALVVLPRTQLTPDQTLPDFAVFTGELALEIDDSSLLADHDANLEMIQNLEFYAWLELQAQDG